MKPTKKALVSVILPAYNAEDYLEEAIQSILDQTFKDFELIIIDDKSTDKTSQIILSFIDPRIVIIKNQKNQGITYSLNKGLEIAKGAYIARMDADDISATNRLELQINYLEQNPSTSLLGCCAEVIDQNGVVFDMMEVPLTNSEIFHTIFSSNCFIHPSVIFKKSVITDLGGYDLSSAQSQDYELWLRVIQHNSVANLPDYLLKYRIHPNQISQKKLKRQRALADRARYKIYGDMERNQLNLPPINKNSFFQTQKGYKPSLGNDHLRWIYRYRSMKRDDLANELIIPGILSAPLCRPLYQQLFYSLKSHKHYRSLSNSLRWYKNKIKKIISGSRPDA